MIGFLLRRALRAVLVVFGVTFATFAMMYLSGDPVYLYADPRASEADIEHLRKELGFDKPWPAHYVEFTSGILRGDLGTSLRYHEGVLDLLLARLPATLELTACALLLSVVIPLPLAIAAASFRGRWPDSVAMGLALLGQSVPSFWLGILLILLFGVKLRWLPISGMGGISHLVLPAVTLSTFAIARNARLLRSSLLEVLNLDYIRTARSKGLRETAVMYRHALKNSMLSVITVIGLQVGFLLGGSIIVETVFAWPGLGRLTIQAITGKDIPLVQGAVVFMALLFVLVNLLVDMSYTFFDPRIRYG